MANIEPEADYFSIEFLDEYFSECEEHLLIVRRALLRLEEFITQPQVDSALLEDLFRGFHSLKGISGMAGLREAEQLAHEMESYLRALRQAQVALTQEGVDGLIAGTRMLEQVVGALRSAQSIPDIQPVIKQLAVLVPEAGSTGKTAVTISAKELSTEARARLSAALKNGARPWRIHFTLSAQLARSGVNVNTIRARLQGIGELIHAAPLTMAEDGVVFEFILASQVDEAVLLACGENGLTCTPYEVPRQLEIKQNGTGARHNGRGSGAQTDSVVAMIAPTNVVRVGLARLDDLMRLIGDLVISRARLKDQLDRLETTLPSSTWRALQEVSLTIERQLRDLREGVMRTRMVPVGEIFERMKFVIRDLARDTEKNINLEINGQQTEIDKFLVERLMDPLLHLVRNAVAHGLERPDERIKQGKPPEGRLRLNASTSGERVVIEVEDDGRGIEIGRVAERAREAGLIDFDGSLDEATLLDLICMSGFSTREEADRASGRGVGLTVVAKTVSDYGGSLALQTDAGQGTRFTIQLPLTLAITDALIVASGGQRFAVPQSAVREVIEVEVAVVKTIEKNEIFHYRGRAMTLLRLARLFSLTETQSQVLKVFVISNGSHSVGIAVDRILGLREIVIRPMTDPLVQVPGIAGATELGDGRIVLILDAVGLVRAKKEHLYD